MAWQSILGHDNAVTRFARLHERGRLSGTFLFVGPPGVGKRTFAVELARVLLCTGQTETSAVDGGTPFTACGQCPDCAQVSSGTHPDLLMISRPEGKAVIPVELLIGKQDKRMREGLLHDLSLKPFRSHWKVALIDDADYLAATGANALLKTLEEPPPRATLILIGTSADKQLPTIRSRCQIVRFSPLDAEPMRRLLLERGIASDADHAARLAELSGGSLALASQMADEDVLAFRESLLSSLAAWDFAANDLIEATVAFADAAGKEAPLRRARAKLALEFAVEFFRQLNRALAAGESDGAGAQHDRELQAAVSARVQQAAYADAEVAARMAERTLDAFEHIDSNANLPNVIAAWANDIWREGRRCVTA